MRTLRASRQAATATRWTGLRARYMPHRRLPALTAETAARFRPERAVVRRDCEGRLPKRFADKRRPDVPPMLRIHGGRTSAWASEGEEGGFGERERARAADT